MLVFSIVFFVFLLLVFVCKVRLYRFEVLWFLLFYQEEVDSVVGDINKIEFESFSLDANEILYRDLISFSEEFVSDSGDSKYEDCQEDEEEDWQTCLEEDSVFEEEEGCNADFEIQNRKNVEN